MKKMRDMKTRDKVFFELLYSTNKEALSTSPHVYNNLNTAEEELAEHLHKGYK